MAVERVRRFKVVIIAAIACAVLLCSAVFSVSFAAWGSKVSPTANAEGSIGSFYVEYPQYGGTAELDPDTYYVQVKKTDDADVNETIDYYPMMKGNGAQGIEHAVAIHLEINKNISFYNGNKLVTAINKDWSWNNSYGDLANGKFTAKDDGWYSFYLKETLDTSYGLYVAYQADKPATPDNPNPIVETLNDVATVRQVNGKTVYNENKGGYVYHNYICVSRRNNVGDYDNSICFLEFEVTGSAEDLNKTVNSIVITRVDTDADGVPKADADGNPQYIDPAPRLYNYDPTQETKLGDISHGEMVDVNVGDVQYPGIMVNHYDNGMYCLLFFADGNQQYFALDIEIVTAEAASFTLTAKASNVNHWQRFKSGYGEPWGFYMGGLINNVWLWDPRRTTKMNVSSGTIDPSNENTFKTVNFGDERGDVEYPGDVIDMTLTVNLTGGSRVKMYMIDNEGHRLKGNTIYLIPNEVICDPDTMFDGIDMYDEELNFCIPVSGSYTFRLVGNVYKREETPSNGKGGHYVKLSDGSRSSVGGDGYVGIPDYNLIVDKLYITNSEGKGTCDVTFDANGGTFDGEDTLKHAIMFGSNLSAPTAPTHSDGSKMFGGWYTDQACTEAFDFNSPVTDDITLYAKWVGRTYEITFDPNGGKLPSGVADTATTDSSGRLTAEQLPTPTAPEGKSFVGWFTAIDGGDKVDETYSFNSDQVVWARYEPLAEYNINFYYNYDGAGVYKTEQSYKAERPETPEMLGHEFVGWYTDTDCTTPYTEFGSTLTEDLDLYAKWKGVSYSINGTMYEFDEKSGVHGVGIEDNAQSYIDTRSGQFSTGELTIKVFYDGKTLTELEEANVRVTQSGNAFVINASADSSKGKFLIGAHRSTTTVIKANIKFIGGNAADEIGNEITAASDANVGWYVVGQFSDWKIYRANKMTATNVEGIYSVTLGFVLGGGEYKIVRITSNAITWYGVNGASVGSVANLKVTDGQTTFYVDEFKTGSSGMYPTTIAFYRIIFDYSTISGWGGTTKQIRVHYWGAGSDVTVANAITDTSAVNSNYIYYDLSADAACFQVIIKQGDEKWSVVIANSSTDACYYKLNSAMAKGQSYKVSFDNGWSGSNWKVKVVDALGVDLGTMTA